MCGFGKRHRRNGGYITVFTVLFLSVFIVFVFFMLELICWRLSNMKAGEAVGQNVKSLFGDFDAQIYEDYHLFMIDASYGTDSEAYLEERLSEQLNYNLAGGSNLFRLELKNLQVSDESGFMQENYAALKKQIHDYCGYAMVESVLDMLKRRNETGKGDAGQGDVSDVERKDNTEVQEDIVLPNENSMQDPRDYISGFTGETLLRFVCPKDKLPSAQVIDLSDMPSLSQGVEEEKEILPDNFLGNGQMNKLLEGELFDFEGISCPVEHLELVFYISSVFHSFLEENEIRTFQGEQEYILYGRDSDQKNLLCTVEGMISLRMPFNYLYLQSSISKQTAIRSAAAVLSVLSQTTPGFMNKVLTGIVCFGESVLDVRALLRGEAVALKKTDATWKMSIADLFLNKLKGNGKSESVKGLYYEDYLMLLMLKKVSIKNMYARLLDVITLNIQKERPAFSMMHGITGATVSYQLEGNSGFSPLPKSWNPNAYLFFFDRSLEY